MWVGYFVVVVFFGGDKVTHSALGAWRSHGKKPAKSVLQGGS